MISWQFKAICEKEQDQRQGLLCLKQTKETPTGQLRGVILWRNTNAENLVIDHTAFSLLSLVPFSRRGPSLLVRRCWGAQD